MSIKKMNGKSNFAKVFTLVLIALSALALSIGCGGGSGGSSSSTVEDIGPIVSIIEGYVYAPSSGATAPQSQAPQVSIQPSTAENILLPQADSSSEISAAAKTSNASQAVSRATIIPTSGYVPLVGATVQLGGTNKATVTNPIGYYRFEIGQKEITAFGSKKLMINKSEANVSIEFDVEIVSGDSRYILTEINTKTGEKTVKEMLTNRVQSPFIFVSGKATGATGVALANALVTAVKVSNTAFVKTAYTDAYGRYSFSEINDGLYTLTVEKANYKTTSKNVEVSSNYTLSNIDFLIPGTFSLTPRVVNPELSAVKIVYATSVPTAYTIEYGLSTTYLYSSTSNLYNLTNEITLTNLSPKTVYHFKIKAIDQYGNTINTDDATFETLDPNTNSKEAPLVNSNYTIRKTHNSVTLTFNTNMSSYAQIEYAVSSAAVYTRYPVDGSEIGPQTNFEITLPNLVNSTTYKLFIITKNIANKSVFRREPQQLPIQVTTDNSPDLTPPAVSGVTITELKAKEATINFSAIDIHESIRNNTDAKIYYGLASYPTLQYDYSVIPPKVRLDYYQKISETLPFNFDSEKVIKLSGLEPSKKYYFRPASNDPSGNIGTVTDEISFTTAAPGTALTFALSESPATGQISVGEHAKIFRIIAKGSTEENLIIKKMVFKQTGSIPYNAIDKLTVTDGVNTWTVTTPVSSNIEVKFDSPTLSIPKNNSMYLTMNMTLNTSALNPGGAPRDVKLKLDANSATETNVDVTGDIYDSYVKDKVSGLALESNAQAVNIGQLVLSPPVETQDSTSTSLVNRGQKDIILFKFKLESLYEDINITKIQLSQVGTAIAETDYSNIRLYDGISSLAVGASSGSDILFQSATGLVKVAKGSTNTKTLSIVADIQQGATDARYLRMQIDKINISGSGSYSAQNVDVLGVGTPVTGAKFTIGDSELLAARTTDSPTKQTFKIGDTNKTFTIFQLTAGSAEDVRIDTMELMFQGTASFTSSSFSIVDENNTVIYSKAVGGAGITAEAGYSAATKKFTVIPQSSLIVPKGSSKKIYIKGNISSTAFEVGKTIQINIANDGDIKGTGVQTNSPKAAVGTAIGSEHSIIGGIVMAAVLPQPSNVLLPGSKYNDTPNNNTFLKFKITPSGESVDVQSFNFSFAGSYSVLDNLRVIEYIDAATTVEVAINPAISGSTITLVPQSTVNITTAGKTFHLVGDILTTAVSSDSIKFSILQDGNVVSGVSSKQIYKTQEIINGNTLSVSTEAFYILQSSRVTPETMLIGSASTQEVYSFKLEAKPRSGYYLQKLTLRQLGTATFGLGQDFSADNFEFLKSGDGVTFTKAAATITVSGTNLSIEFPSSSDVRIDATSQTVSSQFLTCAVVCKTLQTAINNKTLKFYIDDSLTVAKSVTSNNQITGGSSVPVTGSAVTLKEGSLTANIRGDNPASSNITDSTAKDYLSFDLSAEVEALNVQSILVTLDVKNGLITDFNPTSMKISVGGVAYPNSTVSSSGNKFTIIPLDNTAPTPKYLQVPANGSVKVTISGMANYTAAQNGSQIALRIADNSDIMSVGATSSHKIYSTGIINGNYMTVSKSASSLAVTLDASTPVGSVLADTTAANMFIIKLTAGTSEDIKLKKLNLTYDGLANNFDASSINISFGAPVSKSYTSANIVFSNNIFTLDIPVSDTITIPNAGVLVTVNGKRSSTATSGQQFFFRISGDGDLVGTGANSGLSVLSTGTAAGNKFTIDAVNTSIKAYLNVAFSSDNPAAATVAAGQRLLVGKIDLQTKKDAATNFVDSARIKSIELTKGGTTANADVTKWELTDGTSTFTVSNPTSGAIKFDNMNYIVPLASTSTVTTMKTLSIYATVKDSVRNLTLLFTITSGKVLADGALYGNAATVEPWNTTPATTLTSGTQTLDIGTLVVTTDAAINGLTGSASAGDVSKAVLGLNVANTTGTGAATSPEDVYITGLKLTNSGTGVLGTDVDSLKLYELVGATETFIANASLLTDTATNQKYFQFSDSQLYKVVKNDAAAPKNLVLKANVPATATNGKTIKLSLIAADMTAKGYSSSVSIPATGAGLPLTGKNIIIGTNSLTVALDSTSPAETNFSVDETEREVAVFQVKTGTGEGITLNLGTNSFEYCGDIPQADIATVKLKYNNVEYALLDDDGAGAGKIYTTDTSITLANNTTALFSILVKLKPAATPLTLTAGQYFQFKIGGVAPSILSGTSSITTAAINSTNGTPAPTSNKFIAVGKLALESDAGTPASGNILIGGTGVNLFSLKMTPSTENATISSIKVMLDKGSFTTDLSNLKLKKESYINASLPAVGATSIVVTGVNFNTAAGFADFTITGLQSARVTGLASITSTTATFTTNALVAADDIKIQAKTTAFSPAAAAASNTLTFTIGTGVVSDVTPWSGTVSGNYVTFSGLATTISAATTFTVAGDIKTTSAASTNISMKIESVSDISAVGASSAKSITPSGSAAGNTLTTTSGGLTASLSGNFTDIKDVVIGGTEQPAAGVMFSVVQLTASDIENLNITEVKFNVEGSVILDDDFGSSAPYGFWLAEATGANTWNSLAHIGALTFAKTGNIVTVTGNPIIVVTKNSSKHLVIGGTPAKPPANPYATAGRQGKIVIENGWIKASGATSAKSLVSTGSVNYNSGTSLTLVSGNINSAVSSTSPSASTILANQTGFIIAEFDLKSALSSNSQQIEDISVDQIEIYTSCDFANFKVGTPPYITIGANTYTRDAVSSTNNTHVFKAFAPAVTMLKDATASVVKVKIDTAASVSGKIYAKLVASGTKGTGALSAKTITCSSTDKTAVEHSFGNAQMTISKNGTYTPVSSYVNSTTGDLTVVGVDVNVDNTENLTVNNTCTIKVKLEGSVDRTAITRLKIQDTVPTDWLDTGAASNPFTASATYTTNFNLAGTTTLNKNASAAFKVIATIDDTKVKDGDTIKLIVENAGMTLKGASSTQSITSQNEVSNTLTLQKTSVAFSSNTYATGIYKRGDTGKTIIDFNITAGRYQDVTVSKVILKNDAASGTKTSFTLNAEIDNFKVYLDNVLYTGTVTPTNVPDVNTFLLTLGTPITISKGSSRQFKVTADFKSTAVNGSYIKAKTDNSYYVVGDFPPMTAAANITGSASGNEHNVQVIETLDLTLDSSSPNSSNITITPITHSETSGTYGHIATFKLKCTGENATLTAAKFKYSGSSISDISSFEAYIGTLSTYGDITGGAKFTLATIDSNNNKITFTHSGIALTAGTNYYVKIGVKVPSSSSLPTIGHNIRINMDSSNTSDADYPPLTLTLPVKGTAAGQVSDLTFNATAASNTIYIDSSEIFVKAESETISDISLQFPSGSSVSNHKVMELTLANTSFSDYTMDKFVFEIKQDGGTQMPLDSVTSYMTLSVFSGTEKIADAPVSYSASKLSGTFTITNFNSAYKTILKGQSKTLSIKFSSGVFTGVTSPKLIFAINAIVGTHAIGGQSVKGTEYTRIPQDIGKSFSWSVLTESKRVSQYADIAMPFKMGLMNAAKNSEVTLIIFESDISVTAGALDFESGNKLVNLNGCTLTISDQSMNIKTNTTFTNGTIKITGTTGTLIVNALKTLIIGEGCTLINNSSLTSASPYASAAINVSGTIINNNRMEHNPDSTPAEGLFVIKAGGLLTNLGSLSITSTFVNDASGTVVNNNTLSTTKNISGIVYADGDNSTFSGSGAIVTLTINRTVKALNLLNQVSTLSFASGEVASLYINNSVSAINGTGTVTTLTYGLSSNVTGIWPNTVIISNIDQSSIAMDKTIALAGAVTSNLVSVKGHVNNKLTLTGNASAASCTINSGNVDISGLGHSTFIVSATAPTKITAGSKVLSSVSGATTIELVTGAGATITGAVSTLSVTGAVTPININSTVTNSNIALSSATTQTIAIGAAGVLNQGSGAGITVSNVTQAHAITVASGGKIYGSGGSGGVCAVTLGAGTGKTITGATVNGIVLGGTTPNATLAGTATGAVTVNIAAATGNITNP